MADDNNQNDTDTGDDVEAQRLIADAAEDDAEQGDQDNEGRGDTEQLGDAGKKALDAMKRERNAARKELADLKAQLKQYQDRDKTEAERLQEAAAEAKTRADRAEAALRRRLVAEDRAPEHATPAQIRAVAKRVQGDTDEDLEADADELYALLAPKPADSPPKVPARPAERMPRGGGDPDDPPEETDPRKLAALIPRGR